MYRFDLAGEVDVITVCVIIALSPFFIDCLPLNTLFVCMVFLSAFIILACDTVRTIRPLFQHQNMTYDHDVDLKPSNKIEIKQDSKQINQLLRARTLTLSGAHETKITNALTPYESRSSPNERLQKAFHIRNPFVLGSDDREEIEEFKGRARTCINMPTSSWIRLRNDLRARISHHLRPILVPCHESQRVSLAETVQFVTLRAVFHVFRHQYAFDQSVDDTTVLELA